MLGGDTYTATDKCLTDAEKQRLIEQNKRLVSDFQADKLETQAQRNWDLFYKRNETRFFRDRHWTTREFEELLADDATVAREDSGAEDKTQKLLEVGCGVGNLIFPLLQEDLAKAQANDNNVLPSPISRFYYACDFSPRAVDFVRANPLYDATRLCAFQCDITTETVLRQVPAATLDIVTLVFVLSAIHPDKFGAVLRNLWQLLKCGGVVLFRDYGLYDMAQLRFKPGNKIAENFYMRQDGTRSYYFAADELARLFNDAGFEVVSNAYVHRRTVNLKEGIDAPRIFLQGKFRKIINVDRECQ